ncbi:MAG: T9SS type A sorting domain-containing protein [Dysgonomonas sp.]
MKTRKFAKMATVFVSLLLCMSGMVTVKAQPPGVGVDPNVIMLDDFENGSTSKWAWKAFGRGEKASIELASAAAGDPVRFGEYALKFNIDFTNADAGQTLPANLSPGMSRPGIIIPGNDGQSGNKRIGMWIYASPGVSGMWMRVATRPNNATSGTTPVNLKIEGSGGDKINWSGGWKYVTGDLPANYEFHPDGIRFLVTASYPNYRVNGYVIIDNIRITNQSFTEDLTPPTISSLTGNGANLTGTFTTSQIDLAAAFSDQGTPSSGINYNSISISVDGYVYKVGDAGFTVDESANTVSLTGVKMSNGTHNVEVHVEDNFGHITTKTETITVDAEEESTAITTELDAEANVGNPFIIKINTTNSKDVKELNVIMKVNSVGSIDAVNGVVFAPSAQVGSIYAFDSRNEQLTINLKNDITAGAVETLATININISKNCNPTDVLRCSPVSAGIVYGDDSQSTVNLFDAFEKNVLAAYDFVVNKRIVGLPGEVLVTNLDGSPLAGATVYALNSELALITSAVTDANGIASGMSFTDIAQPVNIYAEKDGKYTYTKLIRTLTPLLSNTPSYIRSGTTPDPKTSKTITWVTNPVLAAENAIMKLAKKSEGESGFQQFTGTTKILEYNAVASSGVLIGNSVTVENLEPGTDYIYQVGDGTTWSTTREFTTTTVTNKFSFSAFGDLQASSMAMMDRLIAMGGTIEEMSKKPLFTLNVGDINDTDDRYDYLSYYGHLFDQRTDFAGIDMISGYGNHEYMGNPDADNIKFLNGHHTVEASADYDARIVGTGSYAVEYGNMLVISLDWEHKGIVSSTAMMTEQAKWLEDILSKTDKTWKIVTMHYPIYPNASTPGSQSILAPVFDKYNVQIMFCGHGHTFERVQVYQGSPVVPYGDRRTVTPGIGGTLYFQLGDSKVTTAQGRWIFCEVDGKRMDVTVRDANNNIVNNECFTLYASALEEYAVTFNTVNENGTLTATVDGTEITTGQQVQEGKDVIFTATPDTGYKIKEWKLNNTVVNGTGTTYTLSDLAEAAIVTVEFELADGTGVENHSAANLNIYPNPFTDVLHITGAEDGTLQVMNVVGTVVHIQRIATADETIRLEQLLPGVYFFHVEKDGQTKVIKVIKK